MDKNRASTVADAFEAWVHKYAWRSFGVCGFTSNVCIAATAADISNKGRGRCVVLEDVCAEHTNGRGGFSHATHVCSWCTFVLAGPFSSKTAIPAIANY